MTAQTPAERARAYRERKGATGQPGRPVTAPCGTVAAYKRHRRHGEDPCAACAQAWADWQREYQHARKSRRTP